MNHLKQIAAQLAENQLDAMLITSEPGEFYAVGFRGEGYVLVTPRKFYYSTDSRYIEAAQKIADVELSLIGAGKGHLELAVEHVKADGLKRIGIEEGYMSVAEFDRIRAAMPAAVELVPAQTIIEALRASKDEDELALMRKAQEITDRAFTEVCSRIHEGMTEKELCAELIYCLYKNGAEGLSFDPIVVSGPNTSMPHGVPGDRRLQKGDFITMDFGVLYRGYCSDMTRTVALGHATEKMREVYQTVLKAQLAGLAVSKAGVAGKAVDAAARDVITEAGYGAYFTHSYGHSLGLEIHEAPNCNTRNDLPIPLHAVVSAEPGIYIPGEFGVRIEDVAVFEENGCRILTKSPKELMIL